MVTKRQQEDTVVGPKFAVWIVVLTLIAGIIAFVIAQGAHENRVARSYDLTEPYNTIEQGPGRVQVNTKNTSTPDYTPDTGAPVQSGSSTNKYSNH